MKSTAKLRHLLSRGNLLVAPGAYDGLSARLVEQAGFEAVYMTGAGVSASNGFPDYGLVTMTEMVERAGVMARSVSIPLIADADTIQHPHCIRADLDTGADARKSRCLFIDYCLNPELT